VHEVAPRKQKTWTCGAWARDRYDDPCGSHSSEAERWSAYGALAKCAMPWIPSRDERAAMLLAMRAEALCCGLRGTMRSVNDRLGYSAVMRLMASGLAPDAHIRVPGSAQQTCLSRRVFWSDETTRLRAVSPTGRLMFCEAGRARRVHRLCSAQDDYRNLLSLVALLRRPCAEIVRRRAHASQAPVDITAGVLARVEIGSDDWTAIDQRTRIDGHHGLSILVCAQF
jgi:hypothetical protein